MAPRGLSARPECRESKAPREARDQRGLRLQLLDLRAARVQLGRLGRPPRLQARPALRARLVPVLRDQLAQLLPLLARPAPREMQEIAARPAPQVQLRRLQAPPAQRERRLLWLDPLAPQVPHLPWLAQRALPALLQLWLAPLARLGLLALFLQLRDLLGLLAPLARFPQRPAPRGQLVQFLQHPALLVRLELTQPQLGLLGRLVRLLLFRGPLAPLDPQALPQPLQVQRGLLELVTLA